jgi:hypothetical protein
MFQRNIILPSSGLKCKPSKKQAASRALLTSFLLGLLFDPEDEGSAFLQTNFRLHAIISHKPILFTMTTVKLFCTFIG